MLAAACAVGVSSCFGSPIGGMYYVTGQNYIQCEIFLPRLILNFLSSCP